MKVYIEAFEITEEGEPDFIRIDVTDLTDQEKKDILNAIREYFADKKYVLQVHYCRHDEGKPCEVKTIEVRE